MGRTYSLNGYINAVLQRTSPTLLVEGVTDKAAIHRLAAEHTHTVTSQYAIDHSALIDDLPLHGLGAKTKVQRIQAEVNALTPRFSKLSSVVAFLVDREWDGLSPDASGSIGNWQEPVQTATSFVTIGHSIENYHFHADCFVDYLRFGFAEYFSADLDAKVRGHFSKAIALAGAVSYHARDHQCITRLSGLIGLGHIELSPLGRFHLANNAIGPINARCGIDAAKFVADINAAVDSSWSQLSENDHSRWVLHGHVGSEILWACIGQTAISAGVPANIAENMARGAQAERRRCWLTWLCRVAPELRTPLDQAVHWLVRPPSNAVLP